MLMAAFVCRKHNCIFMHWLKSSLIISEQPYSWYLTRTTQVMWSCGYGITIQERGFHTLGRWVTHRRWRLLRSWHFVGAMLGCRSSNRGGNKDWGVGGGAPAEVCHGTVDQVHDRVGTRAKIQAFKVVCVPDDVGVNIFASRTKRGETWPEEWGNFQSFLVNISC